MDPVTEAKITFISGDTSVGSDNDRDLVAIMVHTRTHTHRCTAQMHAHTCILLLI